MGSILAMQVNGINTMEKLTINQINAIAQPEGWAIFSCEGSEGGDYQIQRLDMEAIFKDDNQAIKHIAKLALNGSYLHKSAISMIIELNPKEAFVIAQSISL